MTPVELQSAMAKLGISSRALATALGMSATSGRTVRRWKSGESKIPHLVGLAVKAMVDAKTGQGIGK